MKLLIAVAFLPALFSQVRIHCGGPSVTDAAGVTWQADQYYTGGAPYVNAGVPAGASPIYATKRYASSFGYSIPVPDGQYTVNLALIESNATTAGAGADGRIFSVSINGAPALANYDLWADAGANVPTVKTFKTTAVNGTGVRLAFSTLKRSAFCNAVEVLPAPAAPPPAAGLQISCNRGLVISPQLVANSPTQDFAVIPGLPVTYRLLHVILMEVVPFTGAAGLQVSLWGAETKLVPWSDVAGLRWFDRTDTPLNQTFFSMFTPPGNTVPSDMVAGNFPFDIVLKVRAAALLGDGSATHLLSGRLYYEVCGFPVQ